MPRIALPPLSQTDAARAWEPWEPTPADPWNLKWAGHLYRRAAFGAPLAELRQAVARELPATLDHLLRGDSQAEARDRFLASAGAGIARQNDGSPLRAWWLYAIFHSPHPLREKLTLFWHNHFATSIAKVQRAVLMYNQNQLLRRHALGKFGPLLHAVSRDPAMLLWLDSNSNVKGRPNENYARELMELFSLGVGHYTEKDVREAARAFTGWHTDDDEFAFEADSHDDGVKTVLGKTGKWNGDDVVGIVLEQPAAARFLVRKLYRSLISETAAPPVALVEPLAQSFRKSDYDVAGLVRTMIGSRHFFSAHAYRQRVKSPVEFVVGAVRAAIEGPVAPVTLVADLSAMGQDLFAPPNVKGWAGGRAWLNTATVLARDNFAHQIALGPPAANPPAQAAVPGAPAGKAPVPEPDAALDSAALVRREKLTRPEPIVALLTDSLLQGDVSPVARAKLVAFLADGKPEGPALYRRVREAVHAILTMPEYQLA
jgi:uncharacterized protein (DUF1800 family)